MFHATISTTEDNQPVYVQVAHRGHAVDLDREHPAKSISNALAAIGYEIDGMFCKVSEYRTHVAVREAPGAFLSYLAGERRGTFLGGLPRLVIDADLMVGVYPSMTLEEADEYDAGEREVRIR